jgi:hypothetical protein
VSPTGPAPTISTGVFIRSAPDLDHESLDLGQGCRPSNNWPAQRLKTLGLCDGRLLLDVLTR